MRPPALHWIWASVLCCLLLADQPSLGRKGGPVLRRLPTKAPPHHNHRKTRTPSSAASTPTISPLPQSPPVGDAVTAATSFQAVTGTSPRFYFGSGFGVQVYAKPGLALQGQGLFAITRKRNYYLGPDVTYTLYAPGTTLTMALGLWYDFKLYSVPKLSCFLGLVVGPVWSSSVSGITGTSYTALFDLALVQEVDDLISVKGQFRPGILGSAFTYVMSFQVAFRFI